MRQLKPIDAPRANVTECAAELCTTPTDRVRVVHGAKFCRACHWQLLVCTVDQMASQALMKSARWREEFNPTPEQVRAFLESER
jgi:hypothetical protein